MTGQGRLVATEPSSRVVAPGPRASSAATPVGVPGALLGLQRQVGNRAVVALMSGGPPPVGGPRLAGRVSQRSCGGDCGCTGCRARREEPVQRAPAYQPRPPWAGGCPTCGDGEHELAPAQRLPSYQPNPPWSHKGADQNFFACVPFAPGEAQVQWELWSTIFPAEAGSRCGCSRVTDVWNTYFAATGGRYRFDTKGDCVHDQLAGDDDAHQTVEEQMLQQVEAAVPRLVATMAGTPTKTFTFSEVGVNTAIVETSLIYNNNTRAGGSLFGGVGDSEYGPDSRHADGEVEIDLTPDPANRMYVSARPRVTFHYSVTDGVDFCPGNTGEHAALILEGAVTAVSRVEASGMARDVFVGANYDRVRYLPPQDQPNPDLVHPVNPQPRHINVPAHALFEFGSAVLRPSAGAALAAELGDDPNRADLSQPIQVDGYTDSKGDDEINLPLSQHRAEAVARFLEQRYPHVAGHLVPVGHGSSNPVAPNEIGGRDNPAGRAQNRRVELHLSVTDIPATAGDESTAP